MEKKKQKNLSKMPKTTKNKKYKTNNFNREMFDENNTKPECQKQKPNPVIGYGL